MDERERRRAYRHNAVLIDSDRVLTPQFDDAIVYLTGAQLELLRNVSQYLNRRETYRAEKHPGYYLMPDDSDYDDILAIVADMEELLMGNPNTIWGYKDRWLWWGSTLSDGSSPTEVDTVAVPAGYVYVLEHWQVYHNDPSARSMTLLAGDGSSEVTLYTAPAVPTSDSVHQPDNVTLKEGDQITLRVYSLASSYRAYMHVWGHLMIVPS